jgi:hypothetical protein
MHVCPAHDLIMLRLLRKFERSVSFCVLCFVVLTTCNLVSNMRPVPFTCRYLKLLSFQCVWPTTEELMEGVQSQHYLLLQLLSHTRTKPASINRYSLTGAPRTNATASQLCTYKTRYIQILYEPKTRRLPPSCAHTRRVIYRYTGNK